MNWLTGKSVMRDRGMKSSIQEVCIYPLNNSIHKTLAEVLEYKLEQETADSTWHILMSMHVHFEDNITLKVRRSFEDYLE